jgi:hypothetical protein
MKTSKEFSFRAAFVLDQPALERALHILREVSGDVELRVHCSDGSRKYPSSSEELLSLPNTSDQAITRIWLATTYTTSPRVSIDMRNDFEMGPSIECTVDGQDKDVVFLGHRLSEWVSTIRQSYSAIAFSSPTSYGFVLVSYVFGTVLLGAAFHLFRDVSAPRALGIGVVGVSLASAPWWGKRVRRRLFPIGLFAVGDGIRRHQQSVSLRRQLSLGATLVAIAASMIGSIVAYWATR